VWAEIQLHAFTSARIGEYLESTCRAGSGRGLHYRVSVLSRYWVTHTVLKYIEQDIAFGVFRNENGKAEFAMQVVKDAKGMTFTPGRRLVSTTHVYHVTWGG
jgi:protein associated with RNAse G/E